MSKPATNLEQMIFTKLNGAELAQVCNDAPGEEYQKQCNACLKMDTSDPEGPRKCVAGIVANFVAESSNSAPSEDATKPATNLQCDPNVDPSCVMFG